jgi:hypothetical protein
MPRARESTEIVRAETFRLAPLTRTEADALDDDAAASRIVRIGSEYRRLAGTAIAFVARHKDEILSMKARYSQQGRRKPVPGCPTWAEVVRQHFRLSYSHMARMLAPKAERPKSVPQPKRAGKERGEDATKAMEGLSLPERLAILEKWWWAAFGTYETVQRPNVIRIFFKETLGPSVCREVSEALFHCPPPSEWEPTIALLRLKAKLCAVEEGDTQMETVLGQAADRL